MTPSFLRGARHDLPSMSLSESRSLFPTRELPVLAWCSWVAGMGLRSVEIAQLAIPFSPGLLSTATDCCRLD